jgi:inner membrane protein
MTLLGHAVFGVTAYGAARPTRARLWGMTRRTLLLCCLLLPMAPDLDVVTHIWVEYGHPLGHRGVSHSLLAAIIIGVATALLLQRFDKLERGRQALLRGSVVFSLLVASHSVTDAMTTGGKAPLLLYPFSQEGEWMPARIIPVSPMGKSLLRTEWSDKQLRNAKRRRTRLMRSEARTHWLVRRTVGLSERPDHARRLQVLGVALTEILYILPFAGIAGFVAARRRRRDPPEPSTPARGPPSSEPEDEADEPPGLRVPIVAACVAGLTMLGLLGQAYNLDRGIEIESGELADEFGTPYVRVAPENPQADAPVALLVHGWRCSHQMMLPLARTLARNGVEAYAIDLPGHADSPVPLDASCTGDGRRPCRPSAGELFTRTLDPVLASMAESLNWGDRAVVLIGHSAGAIAVHDVEGGDQGPPDARIVLEGALARVRGGGNRLIVARKHKLERWAKEPFGRLEGDFEDGSARRFALSHVPHRDLLRNEATNAEILEWIELSTGVELGEDLRHHFGVYLASAVVAAVFGFFAWALVLATARRRGVLVPYRGLSVSRPWLAFLCVLFGSLVGAMVAGELFRTGTAWQLAKLRQTAPIYIGVCAITVAFPYVALAWRPRRAELRGLARDVLVGLATMLALYLSFGAALDAFSFHGQVTPGRWPRVLGWGVAFVPAALVIQEVGPRGRGLRLQLLGLVARIGMWALLLGVHGLGRGSQGAGEVAMVVGIAAAAEVFAMPSAVLLRSRLAPAVTVASCIAWLSVASYPILVSATL